MTPKQQKFVVETLKAINNGGARIGRNHYTVTITNLEMRDLINSLDTQSIPKEAQ